jgi:hypothetical protein
MLTAVSCPAVVTVTSGESDVFVIENKFDVCPVCALIFNDNSLLEDRIVVPPFLDT